MADPITWYALGRDILDTETILEAIDAKLLTHNIDPSAHGQENESVYEHRASELLDHLSYSIYNIKTNPAARVYKAIVGTGIESDFVTLQAAIDWANLYRGGTILIKSGTYTLSQDLVLYSNIELLGEDDDLVTILFSSTTYNIKIVGTFGTHKRNIEISRINFQSKSNLDNWKNIECKYADDVNFERCKFTDSGETTGAPYSVFAENCERINFYNCRSIEAYTMVHYLNSKHCKVNNCYISLCNGSLVDVENSDHIIVSENLAESCGVSVIFDYGGSSKTKVINNTIIDSGDYGVYLSSSGNWIIKGNHIFQTDFSGGGIYLDGSQRNIITDNEIIGTDWNGIKLVNSDHNNINSNIIYGNANYGIDISDAASSRNEVVGNQVYNNSVGNIHDLGTNTDQGHNQVVT